MKCFIILLTFICQIFCSNSGLASACCRCCSCHPQIINLLSPATRSARQPQHDRTFNHPQFRPPLRLSSRKAQPYCAIIHHPLLRSHAPMQRHFHRPVERFLAVLRSRLDGAARTRAPVLFSIPKRLVLDPAVPSHNRCSNVPRRPC